MAEPPAKRAKRTDSSAMWERSDTRRTTENGSSHTTNGTSNRGERRGDRDHRYDRDDQKYRSRSRDRRRDRTRSRDREERRRDKSYSPDRGGRRYKDKGRDGVRDRRYDERSRSRHRRRSRRGWCTLPPLAIGSANFSADEHPPRRSDRPRSRSASPRKDHTSARTRTRTPPHSSRRTRSPSPRSKPSTDRTRPSVPPTGPRGTVKPPAQSSKSSLPPPSGPSPKTTNGASTIKTDPDAPPAEDMDVDSDPEIAAMRKAMGFAGFKSTKNTKVKGNNVYGVRKEKKTEYRQYMNRVGGFNRPLSPSR